MEPKLNEAQVIEEYYRAYRLANATPCPFNIRKTSPGCYRRVRKVEGEEFVDREVTWRGVGRLLLSVQRLKERAGENARDARIAALPAPSAISHTGDRLTIRGKCEKCNTPTNWVVNVLGRQAYWCGCGN